MTLREQPPVYRAVVHVLRPLLRLTTRRDWRGGEHLPRTGPVVVCVNHLSNVDFGTIAHYLIDNGRPPLFLAKDSVFRVPFVGWVLRSARQIPVHRGTVAAVDALASAKRAIAAGACVAIYPEATLTRDPDFWPMRGKTGAARLALATGAPVVPVAQWGPEQLLSPPGNVPHLLPRPRVQVLAGPPVDLDDLRDRPVDAAVLEQATDRIMAAITALLAQLRGEPAPATRYDPAAHGEPATGRPRPETVAAQQRSLRSHRERSHRSRRGRPG